MAKAKKAKEPKKEDEWLKVSSIEEAIRKLQKTREVRKLSDDREKYLKTMIESELGIGEHPYESIGLTVVISAKGRYNANKDKIMEALKIDETQYSKEYCNKSTWNEVKLNKWGSK